MKTAFATLTMLTLAVAASGAEAPAAEKFYGSKCASCHGKDGKGVEKMAKMLKVEMKDLDVVDEESLAKKDEELLKDILEGEKKMPKYKDKLGGLDASELVKYIRGLKPAKK